MKIIVRQEKNEIVYESANSSEPTTDAATAKVGYSKQSDNDVLLKTISHMVDQVIKLSASPYE